LTDDVEKKPERPNANYQLSKTDKEGDADAKEGLTFYYNRSRRLEKAPQAVRDLYSTEKKQTRFSLIRPLIADKPRAFMFFTIIIMCAAIFLLSIFGYFDNAFSLEGNKLEISGTVFEGTTIVVIKKTVKNKNDAYTGSVEIAVSPVVTGEDEQIQVFYHRIFFTLEPVEEYRFAAPYDSSEQLMVLQTENSSINVRLKPE